MDKMNPIQPTSIYLHIPFCTKRCGYCDFTTYSGKELFISPYIDALCKEIKIVADLSDSSMDVHTIFFGGGTPSLLKIHQFEKILETINKFFNLKLNAEISLEANPGSVNQEYLRSLRSLGFNRLSMGAQSTDDDELKFLGRIHSRNDIYKSVQSARDAGFNNISLDMIFGLPGQKLNNWVSSLKDVIDLDLEHVSLYALTIEEGTPFGKLLKKGFMDMPDPDLAADMYDWATVQLENSGFHQYEISNWEKGGFCCKHNMQYWRNLPYLGFGAGAHGFFNNVRVSNVKRINDYIDRVEKIGEINNNKLRIPESPATVSIRQVTQFKKMQETLMLGLRLTSEGVSMRKFVDQFKIQMSNVFEDEITDLIRLELVEWFGDALRLTRKGRLLGNQVFMKFVD